jgi:hypothetical protein
MGCLCRYVAIIKDHELWPLVVSQVCIIVAPAFLAAQDYMIVGRMISFVGPDSSFISHRMITKLFVFVDIVCVITQATGITILTNDNGANDTAKLTLGRWILIGGLMAQVFSFVFFVFVAVTFDRRSQKLVGARIKELRPLFIAFYLSAVLIIGRSVYRTIEFGTIDFTTTTQGYLYNNEWPFYVFDAVPIIIATILFNVVNPANYLPRKKGIRMDGSFEEAPRHWWSKTPKTSTAPSTQASEDMLTKRV